MFDARFVLHWGCNRLYVEGSGGGLERPQKVQSTAGRRGGVEQKSHTRDGWRQLLEDFHPLAAHRGLDIGEASDVAARTRKALNNAVADWIGDRREYDRYAPGCLQHSDRRRSTVGENHFRFGSH